MEKKKVYSLVETYVDGAVSELRLNFCTILRYSNLLF